MREKVCERANDWEYKRENKQRVCQTTSLNLNLYFGIQVILVGVI